MLLCHRDVANAIQIKNAQPNFGILAIRRWIFSLNKGY